MSEPILFIVESREQLAAEILSRALAKWPGDPAVTDAWARAVADSAFKDHVKRIGDTIRVTLPEPPRPDLPEPLMVLMPPEPPEDLVKASNGSGEHFDEVLFDLRGDPAGIYREFVRRYGRPTLTIRINGEDVPVDV